MVALVVVTVSVAVAGVTPIESDPGKSEPVAPAGRPPTAGFTVPLNPSRALMVTMYIWVAPGNTAGGDAGAALIEKFGVGVAASIWMALIQVPHPVVPERFFAYSSTCHIVRL